MKYQVLTELKNELDQYRPVHSNIKGLTDTNTKTNREIDSV
ncbi:hypothetical protein ACOI1C_15295 [Bacillus sp. DJP31]